MEKFKQALSATFYAASLILLGIMIGIIAYPRLPMFQADFPLLQQAYILLRDHGLAPLPDSPKLEYGMIRGMLQAYDDPYTIFVEPVQTELEQNVLHGSYGGIGVRMDKDAGGNYVIYPFPDSPALAAGVKEGDRLLAIENMAIDSTTTVDKIQAAIRGPVGQKVSLTIARAPDFSPQKVSVQREEIPIPSVTWHLEPSEPRLGVVEVNIIAASTSDEIQKSVKDLQQRGATAFALDLRNNGGGLLASGVDIARLFLKDGDIIQQQYRGQGVETYHVDHPGIFADLPMVVLVNQNTASATEIISGALQAHKRAVLIGWPTYGKDSIQMVYDLKDKSSLHITAAKWWIPGLEFPKNGHGLEPDITLPDNNQDNSLVIQAAIKELFK